MIGFCTECGYIADSRFPCETCTARKEHEPECRYRKALEMMVSIYCEHGEDVCPECDPCTCKEP